MTIESAVTFLSSSILVSVGILVILSAVLLVNNLFARFWKSVNLWHVTPKLFHVPPTRFMTDEEASRIAPHLEPEKNK